MKHGSVFGGFICRLFLDRFQSVHSWSKRYLHHILYIPYAVYASFNNKSSAVGSGQVFGPTCPHPSLLGTVKPAVRMKQFAHSSSASHVPFASLVLFQFFI